MLGNRVLSIDNFNDKLEFSKDIFGSCPSSGKRLWKGICIR